MAVLAEAEPHSRIDPAVREAARLLAAGDAETALGRLVPFLSDDPPLAAPRFVLAMAAWRMGRLDWAIDILRYCHERWPMDRDVAEALASLHAQSGNLVDSLYMGKLGTALGAAGPLAEFVPEGFPPFELAIAGIRERPLLEAAKIALDAGELDAAIAKASQHVALDRADGEAASFLAAALLRAGRAAEAADAMAAAAPLAERSAPIASLTARSLAAVGDAAAARRWHDRATALAPDDVAIAAARAADAIWLEHDPAAAVQAWLRRFCPPRKPPRRRAADARLVIIYLVPALADRGDAAAVAAVARAHDRGRVKVIGYGSGARSWPENAALAGAFDEWRDIAALDAATIARSIGRDGADLVVDLAGLRAPQSLIALAALEDAVCVGWLGHGVALEASPYDAAVSAASADPVAGRWTIGGGYPLPPARPQAAERAAVQFGADVTLAQLDAETLAAWSAILDAAADARLVLRGGDTGAGTVDRLVARFGRPLAARIDLVAAESFEAFYGRVDVALAPRRGTSARLAAEATACGVPCVAMAGGPAPYADFLRGLGLGDELVAADERAYVRLALALAGSAAARARIGALLLATANRPEQGPAHFARMLEQNTLQALRDRAAP